MADIGVAAGEWPPWGTVLQRRAIWKTDKTAEEHLWREDILFSSAGNHQKTAELHTVAELTDTQGAALTVETLSLVAVAPPPFPLVEQSHRLPSLRTGDHYTQEQEVLSPSTLIAAWLQSQNMQFNENHSNKKGQQAEGLGAS